MGELELNVLSCLRMQSNHLDLKLFQLTNILRAQKIIT